MTRGRAIVLGGAVATALAGCGSNSNHAQRHNRSITEIARVATATTIRSTPPPAPALVRLQRALLTQMRAAGPDSGADLYDLSSGQQLFSAHAGVQRPPASLEKLYTSVAVLTELGPRARLHKSVLGAGHLGPDGVWHGDLYLRGGGDPSFGPRPGG